jgi:hypothetical protein
VQFTMRRCSKAAGGAWASNACEAVHGEERQQSAARTCVASTSSRQDKRAEYAIGGAILCTSLDRQPSRCYFFLPDPNVGCQPAAVPFWLGAAAMVLTLSFLGFLVSRLLFAMPSSLD